MLGLHMAVVQCVCVCVQVGEVLSAMRVLKAMFLRLRRPHSLSNAALSAQLEITFGNGALSKAAIGFESQFKRIKPDVSTYI
jgi:hypothetical protein